MQASLTRFYRPSYPLLAAAVLLFTPESTFGSESWSFRTLRDYAAVSLNLVNRTIQSSSPRLIEVF